MLIVGTDPKLGRVGWLVLMLGVFMGRGADFEWEVSSLAEEGMSEERLVALSERLTGLNTKGFFVIRNDRIETLFLVSDSSRFPSSTRPQI